MFFFFIFFFNVFHLVLKCGLLVRIVVSKIADIIFYFLSDGSGQSKINHNSVCLSYL